MLRWYSTDSSSPVIYTLNPEAPNPVNIRGDVNGDGIFNISDIVTMQKWLIAVSDIQLPNWKAADFYEDGKLNSLDLCMMKMELLNY